MHIRNSMSKTYMAVVISDVEETCDVVDVMLSADVVELDEVGRDEYNCKVVGILDNVLASRVFRWGENEQKYILTLSRSLKDYIRWYISGFSDREDIDRRKYLLCQGPDHWITMSQLLN